MVISFMATGQGAEGFITDATAGDICREATPAFKARRLRTGLGACHAQNGRAFRERIQFLARFVTRCASAGSVHDAVAEPWNSALRLLYSLLRRNVHTLEHWTPRAGEGKAERMRWLHLAAASPCSRAEGRAAGVGGGDLGVEAGRVWRIGGGGGLVVAEGDRAGRRKLRLDLRRDLYNLRTTECQDLLRTPKWR